MAAALKIFSVYVNIQTRSRLRNSDTILGRKISVSLDDLFADTATPVSHDAKTVSEDAFSRRETEWQLARAGRCKFLSESRNTVQSRRSDATSLGEAPILLMHLLAGK